MKRFAAVWSRLTYLLNRRRFDSDLQEEMAFHISERADELERSGMSRPEALSLARRAFGSELRMCEQSRDAWQFQRLEDAALDLRHGVRMLVRTPVFTVTAIVTLALGIGANTAIFTIVNGVLLRPLGYAKPEQLISLQAQGPSLGPDARTVSAPEYAEFRRMNRSFAAVGAYTTGTAGYTTGEVNVMAGEQPVRVRAVSVDGHLLDALGVKPASGRFFRAEETESWTGTLPPPLAILSDELWQTAFGGQPVVGRTVVIEGRPHEVLGIMPPGVDLMDSRPEIWLPLWLAPGIRLNRGFHSLHVIARLKDGVTIEGARTELHALLEDWGTRVGAAGHVPTHRPTGEREHSLEIRPLHVALTGDARRSILITQAAVAFVLLIACANLSNLVMARAESRRREFAVRASLGATRGRLLRQTMTEGILLSAAGGALGLWLARAGVQALIRAYPASVPRLATVAVDVPVLLFALGLSTATAVLFGLAPPAVRRLATTLSDGARGATAGGRHRVQRVLVTAEVALAVVVVSGAGLLASTVHNLTAVDGGFHRSHLVTFSMTLPQATTEPDTRSRAYAELLDRLRAEPGVHAATAMSGLPPYRSPQRIRTRFEDDGAAAAGNLVTVDYYQLVMSDYFKTLGIPIIAGRGFEPGDAQSPESVAVVNETLAKRVWKGRSPIGQRVRLNLSESIGAARNPWTTVVGIAKDVKQAGLDRAAGTELYVFAEQHANALPTMNVVLKTTLGPAALFETLERVVRELDPTVPMVRLRDMNAVFAESIRRPKLLAQLFGGFAGLALLLAAVGTYGVLSYVVNERGREIAVRMALGAAPWSVIALIMKQGLRPAVFGLVVGLAGAVAANRLMTALLFGVRPTDPTTLAAVVATILVVATGACWLPARRASRLDPNVVLKAD